MDWINVILHSIALRAEILKKRHIISLDNMNTSEDALSLITEEKSECGRESIQDREGSRTHLSQVSGLSDLDLAYNDQILGQRTMLMEKQKVRFESWLWQIRRRRQEAQRRADEALKKRRERVKELTVDYMELQAQQRLKKSGEEEGTDGSRATPTNL